VGQSVYLDSSTKGNSLIRVDALGELTPVEEVRQQALHLGDTGGPPNQHNVVYSTLVSLGILQAHAVTVSVSVALIERLPCITKDLDEQAVCYI